MQRVRWRLRLQSLRNGKLRCLECPPQPPADTRGAGLSLRSISRVGERSAFTRGNTNVVGGGGVETWSFNGGLRKDNEKFRKGRHRPIDKERASPCLCEGSRNRGDTRYKLYTHKCSERMQNTMGNRQICCVLMVPAVEEKVPAVQGKGKHMPANGHSVPAGHTSHEMDAAFRAN